MQLTVKDYTTSAIKFANERPQSLQLDPWNKGEIDDTSESCPNEFGFSDSDSCEANADERESVTVDLDVNLNKGGKTDHLRWDYFPDNDDVVDEQEHIEDDFYIIGEGSQVLNQVSSQRRLTMRTYERPAGLSTLRKQKSLAEIVKMREAFISPRQEQERRQGRLTAAYGNDRPANLCELLRSKQTQPSFFKQNSKGSLDIYRKSGHRSPRNTYYSPIQFRSNPIFDMEKRKRFTQDNTMWESFRRPPAMKGKSPIRQDERSQGDSSANRLSIQRVPESRPSMHVKASDTMKRGTSPNSPTPYQLKQRKQLMTDRKTMKYQPDKPVQPSKSNRGFQALNISGLDNNLAKSTRTPKVGIFSEDVDNGEVIQVEQNYFDHMQLPNQPGRVSSDFKTPVLKQENQMRLQLSEHADKRQSSKLTSLLKQNYAKAKASQQKLDNIAEVNSYRRRLAAEPSMIEDDVSPLGTVPIDESPFKNSRDGDRTVYHLKTNMRHSQETEIRSNVQDGSQRNLFESFGKSGDSKKVSIIQDGGISEEEDGNELLNTAEKPIVPRSAYIPDDQQDEQISRPRKSSNVEEAKEGENLGWFASLSLSMTQMFSGEAADPQEEKKDDKKKRQSSNGEVSSESNDREETGKNQDVQEDETRVVGGSKSVRRRILFLEDPVPSKVKSTRSNERNSNKKTFNSVQSYIPCESDSDKTEEDPNTYRSKGKSGENVISYTTSKHDSPVDRKKTINQINASKNFRKQRQHSSSVHEQISFGGSIKQGLSNLTSSLLQSKAEKERHARGDNDIAVKSPIPSKMQLDQSDNFEQSRFGMIGRLFDRVTKTSQKELNKSQIMSGTNRQGRDKSEDYFSPQSNDQSPLISDIKSLAKQESNQVKRQLFGGRPASKTVYLGKNSEQRPQFNSLTNVRTGVVSQSQEKLRQIDKITFNQDRSHFAVIWTTGGFTKFEVATLQVSQTVLRVPPAEYKASTNQEEPEITLVTNNSDQICSIGDFQGSDKVSRRPFADDVDLQDEDFFAFDQEDETQSDADKDLFTCVALQHRTQDYLATLAGNLNCVISVHIQDEKKSRKQTRRKKSQEYTVGKRTQVKHFSEEVRHIEILPGARYTLICLQTKIYVYTKNSSTLYDIIDCSNPAIYSAIYKSFEDKIVLAYLSKDDPGETLMVHDYAMTTPNGSTDTLFKISQPFSSGYKIGGVQLDELGQRVVVVSADGRFVYLYVLQEEQREPIRQDQAAPADGVSDGASQDVQSVQHHEIVIKAPQQQFARSSSSCQEIYTPIQMVEGFSIEDHSTDYILLSTCSMTTHLFALKTDEELAESQSQQKESWGLSSLLPSYYSLERSKIRLNILEEAMPPTPIKPNQNQEPGQASAAVTGQHPEIEGQNVYKKHLQEFPYSCFVESSGLLVVISYSGYCCKFSIDLQSEEQKLSSRNTGFNSIRSARISPSRQANASLYNQKNLGQSLSLLVDQTAIKRSERDKSRIRSKQRFSKSPPSPNHLAKSQIYENEPQIYIPQSAKVSTQAQKAATAFSGYKHPTLRLKFKIKEFFVSVDQKAASLRRIHRREIMDKYHAQMLERAKFIAKLQKEKNLKDKKRSREDKVSQLRRLLSNDSKA